MDFFLEQLANWKFYVVGTYPAGPMTGLALNILLAILSISIGFVFGVVLGLGRVSCRRYIKYPCSIFIDVVRSTPLLLIIFWAYFVLPVVGFQLSLFWCSVVSLTVYATAYQAEIVRAGFLAVPFGQMDAALSTGMSRFQALMFVILPQAFRMMLPSFVSFFNSMFKNTSTVYIIGVVELTRTGIIISQLKPNRIFASYMVMAIGFWLVCYTLSYASEVLEKKMGVIDYEVYKPEICRQDLVLFPLPKAVKNFLVSNKCK